MECSVSCSELQFLNFVLNKWGILSRFLLVEPIVLELAKKFLSFLTVGGFTSITKFPRAFDTLISRMNPFHILPSYLVLVYFDITVLTWFPCVYMQTLRRFPTFQVATTCFSCSPPDLNLVVTDFMFCLHVK